MFAVAAAHATLPAKIKGTFQMDWHDVRIMQYKAAILKLEEIVRVLKILEKNLDKKQEVGKCIIPLVNYMLSLCDGPLFNVHPLLRKRFLLLNEFKLCKQTEVIPPVITSGVEFHVELANIVKDLDQLRGSIYNVGLQWKLLSCLQFIAQNAHEIYEKKLIQVQIERTANRPADAPGIVLPFDLGSVEDIMKPAELSLCLDWAVLINDRDQDTTFKSLRKLQTQILTKFVTNMNEKALPVLRTYFNQLQKSSTSKGPATATIKELPHWEYTIHRMYAYIYRALCLLDVMVSLSRQIYLPNKSYLHSLRSQLASENVSAYREILEKMDSMCADPKSEVTGSILASLDSCSNPRVNLCVAFNTVTDVFQNSICSVTPILRNTIQLISTWLDMWKFVDSNSDSAQKLANLNDEQLENMLKERLAVDKLNQVEKQKTINRLTPEANGLGGRGSSVRRVSSRRLSAPSSPATSSSGTSPGKMSPLRISRTNSRELGSQRSSNYSSPQLSRRSSLAEIRTPGIQLSSPQISRRSSFADNRQPNPASILMKNAIDAKNQTRSSVGNKTLAGRPRSSSLQTGQEKASKTQNTTSLLSRSNSLQSSAVVNQKVVQDNFSQLTRGSKATNGPSAENSTKKLLTIPSRKPRIQSSNGALTVVNKQGSKGASKTATAPETAKPTLDPSKAPTAAEKNSTLKTVRIEISESQPQPQKEESEKRQKESKSELQQTQASLPGSPNVTCMKKVRFVGVSPMTEDEIPKPTKKGWYKKPAVLHYPPPPPQYLSQKFRMRQEGIAFRSSLREEPNQDSSRRNSLVSSSEVIPLPTQKESVSQRFASKLRERLK